MTPTPPVFDVDTAGRLRAASPEARIVHRAALLAFATTGRAPDPTRFDPAVLAELHERDLVRVDASGAIAVAYPFSRVPTNHLVDIDDGPTVSAMCAIDALGIGPMLGRSTTVRSIDAHTGKPVTVEITDGRQIWTPRSAVVFVGVVGDTADTCGERTPSVVRCCGVLNFFTGQDTAAAWHSAHSNVSGVVLDQMHAYQLGVATFGSLLDPAAGDT